MENKGDEFKKGLKNITENKNIKSKCEEELIKKIGENARKAIEIIKGGEER